MAGRIINIDSRLRSFIRKNWHNVPTFLMFTITKDEMNWLQSDEIVGKWCTEVPTGIYFEYLEDLVMFKMKWM
jgi:hypothetical protein